MNRRLFFGALGAGCTVLGVGCTTLGRRVPAKPKYVFLMIGDGLGEAQRVAAERYMRSKYPSRDAVLAMNRLPVHAMTTTHEIKGGVTDSAAAGTALACGQKTVNKALGLAADLATPLRSIAFDAQDAGKKIGIVTSVPIDHATPASFYAQVPKRDQYYEIDEQLPKSGFDYFAGEPFLGRKKAKGKMDPAKLAEEGGYRVVNDRAGFDALKSGDSKIVVEHQLGYTIDGKPEISLSDLTRKGIELLDGDDGFFMMVEGGKIDWSGHANDLATNIHETLAFDRSVAAVMEFYEKHPEETLVIVTADHETGGLQIESEVESFSSVIDAQKLRGQKYIKQVETWKKEGSASAEVAYDRLIAEFGLTDISEEQAAGIRAAVAETLANRKADDRDPAIQKMYGKRNAAVVSCQHALAVRAGARWTSFGHTGVPVPTTSAGRWADQFAGEYDNTDIALRLRALIGV